jgi:hypothetical protein
MKIKVNEDYNIEITEVCILLMEQETQKKTKISRDKTFLLKLPGELPKITILVT